MSSLNSLPSHFLNHKIEVEVAASHFRFSLNFSDRESCHSEMSSYGPQIFTDCFYRSIVVPINIRRWPTLRTRSPTRPLRARRALCPRKPVSILPRPTRPISIIRERANLSNRTSWILCLVISRPTWAAKESTRPKRDAATPARSPSWAR